MTTVHAARTRRTRLPLILGVLALGVAAVAGLISIKQSGAYWQDTKAVSSATISSGTLTLTAGGSHALSLSSLGGTALSPGDMKTVSVVVANGGDTKLGYKLTSITSTDSTKLTLVASVVTSASTCDGSTAATMPGTAITTTSDYRTLAKGGSEILCLRGTVSSTAVAGATYSGSYVIGAVQQQ